MKLISRYILCFLVAVSIAACKSPQKQATAPKQESSTSTLTEKEELDFAYLFFEASKDKILGNYPQAIAKFSQAIRINPRNAAAHYELSQMYLQNGNADLAEISGQQAIKFDTKNIWYKLSLATIYERTGKTEKIIPLIKAVAEADPGNPEYQYTLANAYSMSGKFEDAIKIFDKLENQMGISEEFSAQKKALYMRLKKPEKALEEIRKLMNAFPDEISYRGFLAEIYEEQGQDENALKEYQEIVRIDPQNPSVYFSLAEYYRRTGDKEKSLESLRKAMKNPNTEVDLKLQVLSSYYELSTIYPELTEQAMDLCSLMVETHPESARARAVYGDFLYREGKMEEAKVQFEKVLLDDKSVFGVWNQLLMIESELKNHKRVVELSTEAIELFPTSPVFYLYSGISSMQLKDYPKAIETLKGGAEITVGNNPLSAQFFASLGDSYNATKQFKESDESYEKALRYDPNNTYVLNNYAYYLSVRKENLDRALELSSKSNELKPNSASFLDTKAWIFYQKADYPNAAIWIDKAIESGGMKSGTIVEHKGDILWKLGKTSDALDFWKRAKELGGTSDKLDQKINSQNLVE
jgi:tetratricopeptide (TPR) repeat protein